MQQFQVVKWMLHQLLSIQSASVVVVSRHKLEQSLGVNSSGRLLSAFHTPVGKIDFLEKPRGCISNGPSDSEWSSMDMV
jgi:hypothetical protein